MQTTPLYALAALTLTALLGLTGCEGRAEKTELVVWQTETDPAAKKVLEEVATQFEMAHPGVDVQIESVPWGSLSTKLNTALISNDPPDVAHIQPFMAYSLVQRGLLSPMDDVIAKLEQTNGPILPAVRDLQMFDGKRYGLAYAVGVTGWTFDTRKSPGIAFPYPAAADGTITREQLMTYLRAVKARNPKASVLLPGGTSFFIDQLYAELVANAGGRLWDPDSRKFLLDSPQSKAALAFLVQLKKEGLLASGWQEQIYNDQFPRLAQADGVFLTPVTYARASVAIEKTLGTAAAAQANAANFRFANAPSLTTGQRPVATIDCEAFVIFEQTSKEKAGGVTKRQLAAEFLETFYRRDNYLKFTSTVPIHLTPVFQRLAEDPAYVRAIHPAWLPWHQRTLTFLTDPGLTRPILVPGGGPQDLARELRNPDLLALQAEGVISSAVTAALTSDSPDIDAILAEAQRKASALSAAPPTKAQP